MKHIFYTLLLFLSLAACEKYDDSRIWDELHKQEERIKKLESLCATLNSNISAIESLVTALQAQDYVTGVSSIIEGGSEIGYMISFLKNEPITINYGKNGASGINGHSPVIGVREHSDGYYYWTIDGQWILDADSRMIPVAGKDGIDGQPGLPGDNGADGENGSNGINPMLKIEDEYWFVSVDNGTSWVKLYPASAADGEDGENGDSLFDTVDTSDTGYVIFTLSDGSTIKLPTWKSFEELQAKVNILNDNIAALQSLVSALQKKDYVTDIVPLLENGKEVGYTIYFVTASPVTIRNGEDGEDGKDSAVDGEDGENGNDGKDGLTPVLGFEISEVDEYEWSLDNGWFGNNATTGSKYSYYWTLNGEFILDEDGNKIPLIGSNGVTPRLKINDGVWYISYDGGITWDTETMGPASNKCLNVIEKVRFDSDYVYVTLTDNQELAIPRFKNQDTDYCIIDKIDITDNSATFTGHISVSSYELPFCMVTLYYSESPTFNVYEANSISTSDIEYNCNFSMTLTNLLPGTTYKYSLCVSRKHTDHFTKIFEFTTEN